MRNILWTLALFGWLFLIIVGVIIFGFGADNVDAVEVLLGMGIMFSAGVGLWATARAL